MLVLSRYKDQSIYIGDDIIVTIVDVRGDRIKVGIQAPPDVPIYREELMPASNHPVDVRKGDIDKRSQMVERNYRNASNEHYVDDTRYARDPHCFYGDNERDNERECGDYEVRPPCPYVNISNNDLGRDGERL